MPPLLAIGSAALDIKARLTRPPLPSTDVPGQITLKPGGVARNIAENLARLGVPIVFAGIMGDDPQARLLIELSRATGIDVRPLARSAPAPDDVYRLKLPPVLPTATLNVVLGPDGRQLAGAFSGDILDALQPGDLDPLQAIIDAAPAVICDGGLPADVLLHLREVLPEEVFLYGNPGSVALAPRLVPLLDRMDLITCNQLEAQALTQVKVDSPAKLISSALILVKQGVRRAVVTFGARGLAYADEERSLYQPVRPARLIDATGAGDALAAALIEALLRDEPIGLCLTRGLAAAALTCESEGTVAPSMSMPALEQRIRSTLAMPKNWNGSDA
ncbi:MAG TPA: PfkB family carbohydrate kinase [Anaerolineae bacterium]|nr:PfkB family carbohydrate kinase [Anaerolineae bacterium]